jgi:regulatory protein
MMRNIIGLKAVKGREKRVRLFFNDDSKLDLLAEVALKEGLGTGQEVTDDRLASLTAADNYQRCCNAAIRLLGYRPRSEAEIRQRLRQRGFDNEYIEKALTKLKGQGLVDDTAFARFWKDNRETLRPRSRRLTRLELQKKGLQREIIESILTELDDNETAYRAALKARRLPQADYQGFRRRLGEYLMRRGYGWDVINSTVEKVWRERTGAAGAKTI